MKEGFAPADPKIIDELVADYGEGTLLQPGQLGDALTRVQVVHSELPELAKSADELTRERSKATREGRIEEAGEIYGQLLTVFEELDYREAQVELSPRE